MEKHISDTHMRLMYWDIAKGICILLMVLGHLPETNAYLRGIIFTFHMPLFFIANSFFIKDYDFKKHLYKAARSILLPYCIVCVICTIISTLQSLGTEAALSVFLQMIKEGIGGFSRTSTYFTTFGGVWMIWFLPCLFLTKLMYIAIMKMLQYTNIRVQAICFISLSILGMLTGLKIAYLPWSLDIALTALPFMWTGEYLRKTNILNRAPCKLFFISFLIWIALGSKLIYIDMAVRHYPGLFLSIAEGIAGSLVIILFSG